MATRRMYIPNAELVVLQGVASQLQFPGLEAIRVFRLTVLTGISSVDLTTGRVEESAFLRVLLLDQAGNRPLLSVEPRGYNVFWDGTFQLSMIEGMGREDCDEVIMADDCFLRLNTSIPAGIQFDVILDYEDVALTELKAVQQAWGA